MCSGAPPSLLVFPRPPTRSMGWSTHHQWGSRDSCSAMAWVSHTGQFVTHSRENMPKKWPKKQHIWQRRVDLFLASLEHHHPPKMSKNAVPDFSILDPVQVLVQPLDQSQPGGNLTSLITPLTVKGWKQWHKQRLGFKAAKRIARSGRLP